jgi:hypothetical protein
MPPWVRYCELTDLEGVTSDSPEAVTARLAIETWPQVLALLADIGRWPGTALNSHKSVSQVYRRPVREGSLEIAPILIL